MLHLFNPMGRKCEPFVSGDPEHARMYVCGPTVYSYAHIGNARPAVVFDVLARVLRDQLSAQPSPDDMAPVRAALDDDLNTTAAFAALHALAGRVHSEADPIRRAQIAAGLRQAGGFLGLLQQDPAAWAQAGADEVDRIEARGAKRVQARLDRAWSRADTLRGELVKMGIEVEDSGGESRWRRHA